MTVSTPAPNPASEIVLASASAARTRMLSDAGVVHICDPADIDEDALKQSWRGSATDLAQRLALEKAQRVAARHPTALVIGADQVLALDDDIFDKPGTLANAKTQLQALRGRRHRLISAVALVQGGREVWSHTAQAQLNMRDFSKAFLDDYLRRVGNEVLGSVGAYHLEGLGAQLFDAVEGDFFTVLGLPLTPLLSALRDAGALQR